MKMIFLIRSLANAHGVERTITDKANYMSRMGHSVLVLTYEQGQHPFAFPLDSLVKHADLECRFFTLYKYSFVRRLVEARKMRQRFKQRLLSVVKEFQAHVLITTAYSTDFMSEIMAVSNHVRIVVESHSAFIYDNRASSLLRKLWLRHYVYTLKKCDLMIALTHGDASFWKRSVRNVRVVVNPVSYYCEDVSSIHRQPCRIIAVGRLYAPKRFDRLIKAFAMINKQFPDWYLDIYGEGEDREKLEKQISQLGVDKSVRLHSLAKDIFAEYQSSQFLVVSSDFEGFSLVVIEAMGCGLPVVSTACPYGPREIIDDGVTGLLSDMNSEDLADKMKWMITHSEERLAMGNRAHEQAARYRMEEVMKEWETAYLSVLL